MKQKFTIFFKAKTHKITDSNKMKITLLLLRNGSKRKLKIETMWQIEGS
jgi:hypothetical protein